ncbi:MAG: hypothetical protein KDD45_17740, partial [Bdellovibrionales bacterium]|nr:hypothetical protein [Bdellovibrionales bacterium]
PFDLSGASSPQVVPCSNAYPDSLNSRCIPCGPSTSYDPTLGCQCLTANQYWVMGGCYINANGSWIPTNSKTTAAADYLVEVDVQMN